MTGDGDLVVIALGGVQTFITESRTTADLAAASGIMSALAAAAARAAAGPGVTLVFPEHVTSEASGRAAGPADPGATGVPNRVVLLAEAGTGREVAERAAAAVRDTWAGWVRQEFRETPAADPDTPGFPEVSWVRVPADRGDYAATWAPAQRALAARRGLRAFDAVDEGSRPLCSLSPRWVSSAPPPTARRHHRQERLSRANWVKRQRGLSDDGTRFPSTYAISSAAFRRAVDDHWADEGVAEAVRELHGAAIWLRQREAPVPGLARGGGDRVRTWLAESAGPWVHPGRWQAEALREEIDPKAARGEFTALADRGGRAAQTLIDRMRPHGVPAPATYLAVIAQDLDGMGEFLATGPVTVRHHQEISRRLIELAGRQTAALRDRRLLGVPVYAGGDDLLAFTPAATALDAAAEVHRLVRNATDLPEASTAVLFFHQHTQLRQALVEVQRLLKDAKAGVPGKHALAVGYLRRSGAREESIQPWLPTVAEHSPETLFARLGKEGEFTLSPRLVTVLERDAAELAALREDVYRAELRRLVGRHTGGGPGPRAESTGTREQWVEQATEALLDLGAQEYSAGGTGRRPAPVARVGVFLRQEAR